MWEAFAVFGWQVKRHTVAKRCLSWWHWKCLKVINLEVRHMYTATRRLSFNGFFLLLSLFSFLFGFCAGLLKFKGILIFVYFLIKFDHHSFYYYLFLNLFYYFFSISFLVIWFHLIFIINLVLILLIAIFFIIFLIEFCFQLHPSTSDFSLFLFQI